MPQLIFITGLPGSGKSTLARELAKRREKAFLLPVDSIREMVVSGYLTPESQNGFTSELNQQFMLEREAASLLANHYLEAGFDVIVEDVCLPPGFLAHFEREFRTALSKMILLNPSAETLRKRLEQRGDVHDLTFLEALPMLHPLIQQQNWDGWQVFDTSDMSVETTLSAISANT